MARMRKEQADRLDGMQLALEIATKEGVDALRSDVNWRCANQVSPPCSQKEIIAIARSVADEEFMRIATAVASTVSHDLKLPPSKVREFLKGLNDKMDDYRADPEVMKKAQQELDDNFVMNETIKKFLEEE